MKTYEEMARDVLKRRDEELQLTSRDPLSFNAPPEVVYPASPKKRRLLPRIAIPCAAAVTAAAVGICVWNKIPQRTTYRNNLVADADEDKLNYIYNAFSSHKYVDPITPVTFESVYKGGKTDIHINSGSENYNDNNTPHSEEDFISIPDDKINSFYRIEFDRLTNYYTDWKSEHAPFGYYNRDIETSDMVEHPVHGYYSYNQITYTTESGEKLTVSASYEKLRIAGENEKTSLLNGFDAFINQLPNGDFVADINMGANVRITAESVSEARFLDILDVFTMPSHRLNNKDIKIHEKAPEFFEAENPFKMPDTPNLDSCDFKQCTIEQLNDYYGIEFDRLTRLHKDWKEWHADYDDGLLGIYTDPASGKIVYARNYINYQLPNGAFIDVTAKFGGELPVEVYNGTNDFIPPTTYSTINGCQAMLSRSGFAGESYDAKIYPNGDQNFGAVIKMGNTLVHFKTAGLTEEQFITVLKEYTENYNADNTDNDIVIHPKKPQAFAEKDPFFLVCGNLLDPEVFKKYTFEQLNGYYSNPLVNLVTIDADDLVKYTMEELNSYYGIEFDRLTRLHGDWEELHGNLGIYRHKFNYTEYGDYDVINWTHNAIHYTLPDSSVLTVEAQEGGKLPDPETWSSPTPCYSRVNGCKAMIYLDGDDSKTYPNGSGIITAVIEKNGTLIRLRTAGFTEEQFLNVLDEYTK